MIQFQEISGVPLFGPLTVPINGRCGTSSKIYKQICQDNCLFSLTSVCRVKFRNETANHRFILQFMFESFIVLTYLWLDVLMTNKKRTKFWCFSMIIPFSKTALYEEWGNYRDMTVTYEQQQLPSIAVKKNFSRKKFNQTYKKV